MASRPPTKSERKNFISPHCSVEDPPQKRLKADQKPSSTNVSGNVVSGNKGHHNGNFSVGNTTQKHALTKDKVNSTNSSANAKSSPPSQTQITKDDKPKDSTIVSDNQVSRNIGDYNGSFSVGNTTQEHALEKDKANSSNSSTSAKSSPPSQTQITKDNKPEDDRKPCTLVSGNQINDNEGNGNGSFSVGNT